MTNMQKGRFSQLGQRLVAQLGRAGARSATAMRGQMQNLQKDCLTQVSIQQLVECQVD